MHVAAAGDRGLMVWLDDVDAATLHASAAAARRLPDVRACIPGHASLLVIFNGEPRREMLLDAIAHADPIAAPSREHVIDVHFDGVDLEEFLTRVDRDEFLARVPQLELTARYIGFRGGFAYLDGWPPEWAMPRRPTSRPVRAGCFGIAGAVAGFYPIDTPGGWNILGHTEQNMEHAIAAGDRIRIHVVQK